MMNKLLKTFVEKTTESGCRVHLVETLKDCIQFVKPMIDEKKFVLFNGDNAKKIVDLAGVGKDKLKFDRGNLGSPESLLGITDAVLAVAETGTIVLFARSTDEQLVSLAPSTLIIFLSVKRIVERFEDVFHQIHPEDSPYILLLSGPSVTADIEKEIVRGVHGPKDIILLLMREG